MDPRESARRVEKTGLDVGFLCAGWPPDVGGVESHAQDLARALAARGHRVHVLCLDVDPEREPFTTRTLEVDGVDVRRMAYAYGDHDRLAAVVVNRRAEDVIHAWLAEVPCDLVHVHHLTGFGMGALRAVKDVGAPLVHTLHDYWALCPRGQMLSASGAICARPEDEACATCLTSTWPHLMPSGTGVAEGPEGEPLADDREAVRLRTAFALEMLALPDRLLTPSAAAREVYVRAGLDRDRIEVCENGVDVDALAREVERLRGAGDRGPGRRVGVLGTVLPSKGVLELARAFVAAEAGDLTLEVHGNLPPYHGDDSYVRELGELADSRSDLTVHGPYAREELPGILAGLDAVAAPSRWDEVYGLSVREARAAGLAVLASDAGALSELSGEGVRLVERDDWAAWSRALAEFARGEGPSAPPGAARPRSTTEMMLQAERVYVEVVREATGAMPALLHPVEGLPAARTERRGGLLRRLFGGR